MKIVIIDNEYYWLRRITSITTSLTISDNLEIDIQSFKKYDEKFRKILYDDSIKIYIIDLQLDDINGYDIAHEIRDLIFDWKSIIILVSVHNEKENVISQRFSILTYVSKNKYFDSNLSDSIKLAINILANQRFIEIKEHNQTYKLPINDITEIIKEKYTKYCLIKTINNTEFRVRTSLSEINKKVNFKRINNYTLLNPNKYLKQKNQP